MFNLWSTPVLLMKMDDNIRENFVNYILQEYNVFNPPTDYNKINILQDASKETKQFKEEAIKPAFNHFLNESLGLSLSDWNNYRLNGWLTGSGRSYSMKHHNHSNSQVSAVFYLLTDHLDEGGRVVFTDPRQNANRGYDLKFSKWFSSLEIKPKSGDVLIFPSYLYHYVETYQSNLRLALPVDCFLFADS